MKTKINKAFAVLVLSTVFAHVMMLLNRHPQYGYYGNRIKDSYYYFVSLDG